MTRPIPEPSLPYLHIDDLTVHIPPKTDFGRLTKTLASAAATGNAAVVDVIDDAGKTIQALVFPARARIIAVSEAAVILSARKNRPVPT